MSPDGPIVDVAIGVSTAREQALKNAGQQVPARVVLRALVDTGASTTCVNTAVIAPLGLQITGNMQMLSASTGSSPVTYPQYDASLVILHGLSMLFDPVGITACPPFHPSFQVLFGRDLLSKCLLIYDGISGNISLAF